MKHERIDINYRIEFESAFHLGTGMRGGIVHRLVARDPDGLLYIPGSTLKGALRDRCTRLAECLDIETPTLHEEDWREVFGDTDMVQFIFGSRFRPGQVYFDDALLSQESRELFGVGSDSTRSGAQVPQTEQRTRVSLSRLTRTAQPGRLFTSEYGLQGLSFDGRITGLIEGTPLFESSIGTFPLLLLVAGLVSLDRLGADKSSGAGRIRCTIEGDQIKIDQSNLPIETLFAEIPAFVLYEDLREEAINR
ncbi:MAG: hypothetical protein GX620_16475 [Chloroflexi bacterium]|nr:hypothetical protein [Chloroflexota bacterium]